MLCLTLLIASAKNIETQSGIKENVGPKKE